MICRTCPSNCQLIWISESLDYNYEFFGINLNHVTNEKIGIHMLFQKNDLEPNVESVSHLERVTSRELLSALKTLVHV